MKKIRISQASTSRISCTESSKTEFLLWVSLRDKRIVLYWYMIQLTIVLMNKNYYKVDSKFTKTYVIRKATNKQTQPVISKTYNKSKYTQHSHFFDNIISEFI